MLPYEAMYGMPSKIWLKSILLLDNIICNLKSEDDFKTALNFIATSLKSSNDCSDNEKYKIQYNCIIYYIIYIN